MGVRDLWLALSAASQTRTLTQIAVTEGFERERHLEQCLFVGIDSSIWMNEAQLAISFRPGRGTRAGENPAVRVLFYRLCRLLTLPIIPIFVFDGPDRPKVKRGVNVKTGKPHWLSSPLKKFIEAFGFFWYTAAGEAEADLAELNRRNFIDAIISEDNDNLVFGAHCVIRMRNVKEAGDQVTVFNSESIKTNPRVSLSREALFFMAILCGGDYDKVGLEGCGWKTARLLAQSELAKSLFIAASTSTSRAGLKEFLCDWRRKFRILLAHDPQNILGRRYPSLVKNVTDSFPSIDLLLQYAQPLTSWTMDQIPDTSSWQLRQPRLSEIATLCEKFFSWGSSGDIVSRFKETLWRGIAIRHLLQLPDPDRRVALYASDTRVPEGLLTTVHVLRICQARLGPGSRSTHPDVHGYTVQISTHGLLHDTALGLDATSHSLTLESDCAKISFWIPGSILRAALPNLVGQFRGRNAVPPVVNYPPVLAAATSLEPPEAGASAANPIFVDNEDQEPASATSPIIINNKLQDSEFVQGSSTGAGLGPVFLGHVNLCTPSPSP
ncbi:PIN domain-like protein [Flammula alnicola]|nr:PIN domain-like protein [Flammula alnicola]